jgi:D-alanyl-D-alanine carboxypeptidase
MLPIPPASMAMNVRLLLCILGLFALSLAPARAQIAPVASPSGPVPAGPYVVVDVATGETLLDRNAGTLWYPASLTKMMTIYIVFEELKAGRLTLATTLPFSENARNKPASKLGLAPGQGITVEQGLQALVARSANDVATAFGERISGSEPAFAQRMTDTAQRLGMTATTFRNANGWPDPGQTTTARDMAMLALALLKDFPQYYAYFRTKEFMLGKQRIGTGHQVPRSLFALCRRLQDRLHLRLGIQHRGAARCAMAGGWSPSPSASAAPTCATNSWSAYSTKPMRSRPAAIARRSGSCATARAVR